MSDMWYVYIVKCNDGTLYTGITTDPKRREYEHNMDDARGAKSIRGKRPVQLVFTENHKSQDEARKRECEIKGWKRKYKLKLISDSLGLLSNYKGIEVTEKITKK